MVKRPDYGMSLGLHRRLIKRLYVDSIKSLHLGMSACLDRHIVMCVDGGVVQDHNRSVSYGIDFRMLLGTNLCVAPYLRSRLIKQADERVRTRLHPGGIVGEDRGPAPSDNCGVVECLDTDIVTDSNFGPVL